MHTVMIVSTEKAINRLCFRSRLQFSYSGSGMPAMLFITAEGEPVFMSQAADKFSTTLDAQHPQIAAFIYPGTPGNKITDFIKKMETQLGKKVITD